MKVPPFTSHVITSGTPYEGSDFSILNVHMKELLDLLGFSRNKLIEEGYRIIGNQVFDPLGRVINDTYKHH